MGLNVADVSDAAREFETRYAWTWPSIVDGDRALAGSLGAAYQPVIVVVDTDGQIVGQLIGGGGKDKWEELANLI